MWKSKKFIVIVSIVAAVVVLVSAGVGVALAADNPPAATTPAAPPQGELLARVAKIMGVDQAKLEAAFKQAEKELADQRVDQWLKKLVTDGKLTQQQADQYKQWLQSRPNVTIPRGPGGFKGPMMKPGAIPQPPQTRTS
jgi:hypothetical protein